MNIYGIINNKAYDGSRGLERAMNGCREIK
jgi:hypothetical protein